MKMQLLLILVTALLTAPSVQARGFGFDSLILPLNPNLLRWKSESADVARVDRTIIDRTVPFVISRFDAEMISQFARAWKRAGHGFQPVESVVLILRMVNGGYSARPMRMTNERNACTFAWHPATVAIVHTHPNRSNPRPRGGDIGVADKYGVPIFTITSSGMFVYDPRTKTVSIVKRNLDWLDPSKWANEVARRP